MHLLLAAALLFSLPAFANPQKKAAAREQLEKAEKLRTALQGKPQKDRTESEYRQVINSFYRVYMTAPQASESVTALLARAELYEEMGRQFDQKYFQSAIDAYQFLLHEYPTTRYRDEALFTVAQIQYEDLEDADLAQKTFEEFLKRFPRSEKAEEAREALAEIASDKEQAKRPAAKKALDAERARENKLPRVTSIRHWNAENYTRVVVDIEDAVVYRGERISNPDRIYFDLQKAKLSSALAGKTLDVQNGFLKTIRVAQNQLGVVRIVLEVDKVKDYSVFFLPNPYRMVIDVFGENLTTASKSESKPPPAKSQAEEKTVVKAERPAPSAAAPARSESAPRTEATHTESPRSAERAATKHAADENIVPAPPKTEKFEVAEKTPVEKPGKGRGTERAANTASQPAGPAQPSAVPQPTKSGQYSMTRALGLKIGRIVIDAGHGGHDTGTIGPTGLMEKDLCLDIAMRLGKMIQDKLPGAEVIYTREDDTFVPLENRTAIANQARADMFISIHANSSRDKSARGVETYYLSFASSEDALEVASRENALSQSSLHELQDIVQKIARNDKIEESKELASEIQKHLATRLQKVSSRQKNRGVKKAPFVVLIGANMPSVLAEVSFISNPTDESLLKKHDHRTRVAEGLFKGLESYLQSLNSVTYNAPRSATGH
jgi:N-acetylmuramoyl-L-alanine amidase